ncbi:uncharacterized protein LOC143366476 isoform X2 [Andrena cerasifolii]|uniref:uncharacterized protein LOC143366476 isoform X2 n=1 Tax=Andrena cerasifolii TaxID=2819439 RepID=UPI004037B511
MLCKVESTRGNGVAEAIGNWGFSNKVSSPGRELQRLKYLSEKMACMKTSKPMMCVKYNCKNDPEACIGTDLLHIIPGRSYVLQGAPLEYFCNILKILPRNVALKIFWKHSCNIMKQQSTGVLQCVFFI